MQSTINRRLFLKGSAFAAAAIGFPSLIPSTAFGANDRIAVGCIGVGGMGTGDMKSFLALDGACRVVAVCDVQRDRRERAKDLVDTKYGDTGCAMISDFRDLIARKDIDAVVIAAQDLYRTNYYDCIFNLFTSFGYFSNERDNYQTINAVCKNLKAGGFFVLDFFNSNRVLECLVKQEERVIEGISFQISKKLEDGFIVKQIAFKDKGQEYFFEERVKALQLSDFEKYFASNKLKIVHLRGNYHLDQFDEKKSERLILIAQKINS